MAGVREIIEDAGAWLRYRSPYSPDFDPIKRAFAKLKAFLRKIAAGSILQLWDARDCSMLCAHLAVT